VNLLKKCDVASPPSSCTGDIAKEIVDLNGFRAIVQGIVDKGGKVDTSITAIVTIHHNLVTFGVKQTYLEPGNKRTYYSPSQACKLLEQNLLFAGDFGGQSPCGLIAADAGMYPGQDLPTPSR